MLTIYFVQNHHAKFLFQLANGKLYITYFVQYLLCTTFTFGVLNATDDCLNLISDGQADSNRHQSEIFIWCHCEMVCVYVQRPKMTNPIRGNWRKNSFKWLIVLCVVFGYSVCRHLFVLCFGVQRRLSGFTCSFTRPLTHTLCND